ncbi:hypothetical protein BW730_05355 [Tessaracoccus aquimaris]|uniref:Uncharacterized protein n=1 Tax=Tessaracoccus aquimaris TaxID=1332264 RepID=A0A1Q2CLP2_9ACTN|nr:hypothetical protein [Tessaracoccus aquimaris]AQP47026.1 hypothetical protein BW730_05355 [Tessaracoccus aquimaris]
MGRQRGMSGSVQAVILLPAALGIFLLLVQWSMLAWADAVALAAAEHGAAVTAVHGGTESDGRLAAQEAAGEGRCPTCGSRSSAGRAVRR